MLWCRAQSAAGGSVAEERGDYCRLLVSRFRDPDKESSRYHPKDVSSLVSTRSRMSLALLTSRGLYSLTQFPGEIIGRYRRCGLWFGPAHPFPHSSHMHSPCTRLASVKHIQSPRLPPGWHSLPGRNELPDCLCFSRAQDRACGLVDRKDLRYRVTTW